MEGKKFLLTVNPYYLSSLQYLPNTQKLVTDKPHQEESLFVLRNKKDEGEKSKNKQIKSQITKFLRFKVFFLSVFEDPNPPL